MLKELSQRAFFFCACSQTRLCCYILSIVATHCFGSSDSNIIFRSKIQQQKRSRRNHSCNTWAFDIGRAVAWLCATTSVRTVREQPRGHFFWLSAPLTSPLPTWDLATASPNTLPKPARGAKTHATVGNFMWHHFLFKTVVSQCWDSMENYKVMAAFGT